MMKAGGSKEAQDVKEASDAATVNCKKKSTGGRAKKANRSVDCAVKTTVNCKNSRQKNMREVMVVESVKKLDMGEVRKHKMSKQQQQ